MVVRHNMMASEHLRGLTLLSLLLMLMMMPAAAHTQTVKDFTVKNRTNSAERTRLLDLLRKKMQTAYHMEFTYVVHHFKVSGNFAWFRGEAQRQDGKKITLDAEEAHDCCHVECLFKKVNNTWTILEYGAFSTDVWWEGLGARVGAPAEIF